ncbi:phosphoenolpyruvate synthase [Arthrobacter sp. IA7]|uniref:PEP/pyruvate-binding domain-containing protein n=1 Tax=Arthrobacter ipis TaxID=2716202 RepID=UPI001687B182|nr:PEP/pyruvate-binding domain-containing protein [Arthrobacter ipis]MBD1544467.1 phosphoenolpyruvate synthase [Arthrobacter ipis]
MTRRTTGPLGGFGREDLGAAGGKGAALGELLRHGFPVPPGFVITTDAYRSLLADTGLGAATEGLDENTDDGGGLRALFARFGMPAALRAEIGEAYTALGGGAVAVRSSATAEDLPGAAFAGQQDTFLNVVGEEAVAKAVTDCWASLWTDRAIAYRRRQGIDPREVSIAVVVQKMVPADAAGVMFSANPVTGERGEIVVDASPGLGEAVVSGRVTPERYLLTRTGKIRSFVPGGGEVVISPVPGGGTREQAGSRSPVPCLAPAQLRELADLARRAQEHFGRPQDIEWALAGGRIHVLQSRPMTALPPQPLRLNAIQRRVGPFFIEMFQERPYPLDVSGWMKQGILAMLQTMAGSVGVRFPAVEELLPEEDGVVVQLVPPVPRLTVRTLAAPLTLARRARQFNMAAWKSDSRFITFLEQVQRLNGRDTESLRWSEVVGVGRECFATMRGITELRSSYLPGIFVPMLRLRLMLLLLGHLKLASALIAGAETRTSQANRALEQLATMVRADPGLATAFASSETSALLRLVEEEPAHAAFREALTGFLREYGNRETVSVVLSSSPTWSDAPGVVLLLVKALLGQRPRAADQTGAALAALKRHPLLRFGPVRRQVLAAVEDARAGMAFREDSHFYATKVIPPMRRAYHELGRRLVAAGVIDDAKDVYHLRFEELEAITDDGGALPPSVRQRYRPLVQARAAKRRELEGIPLLDTALLFRNRRRAAGVLVSGTPASRGRAEGPVTIIRGPEEFGRLRSGDVLVCPYTNPSWTPLFQRAAAVVVDMGGLGSHAAIVAREYGIPAVMGTGTGTGILAEGQRVVVDGGAGTVLSALADK